MVARTHGVESCPPLSPSSRVPFLLVMHNLWQGLLGRPMEPPVGAQVPGPAQVDHASSRGAARASCVWRCSAGGTTIGTAPSRGSARVSCWRCACGRPCSTCVRPWRRHLCCCRAQPAGRKALAPRRKACSCHGAPPHRPRRPRQASCDGAAVAPHAQRFAGVCCFWRCARAGVLVPGTPALW